MSYSLISKEELTLLTSTTDNRLVMQDLSIILEEKGSFTRYLRNIQSNYRAKLANMQAVWKEWEVYMWIKTIEEIISGIESLKDDINKIEEEEKKKKEKK